MSGHLHGFGTIAETGKSKVALIGLGKPWWALSRLRTLRSVFGSRLFSVFHSLEIKGATDDVVAHTRKVFDSTATDQHHRVLLEVVAFTTDVANDFKPIGETNLRDFSEGRVRLFWGSGVDPGADTTALRARLEGRALAFDDFRGSWLANQLVNGGHVV